MVVDEGSGVADVIFEAIDGLTPTRILIIGNPLKNTGRFAEAFKDPNVNKIHISAFDTPNVKALFELGRVEDGYVFTQHSRVNLYLRPHL